MRILFVCLGNICRSPLAEAIFRAKIQERRQEHLFEVDSCGTSNFNIGDEPDPHTIRSASQHHIPIAHRARQYTSKDAEVFDIILAMDSNNYENIIRVTHSSHHHKVRLMRSYDPVEQGDVPDPYYGSAKDFEEVYSILDRCVDALLKDLP